MVVLGGIHAAELSAYCYLHTHACDDWEAHPKEALLGYILGGTSSYMTPRMYVLTLVGVSGYTGMSAMKEAQAG